MVWTFSYSPLYRVCKIQSGRDHDRVLTSTRGLTKTNNDPDLRVYITGDGSDVYEDTFLGIAKPNGIDFKPTLILVGTRLGLDKITPVYWEALKSTLHMSQSIGIAG